MRQSRPIKHRLRDILQKVYEDRDMHRRHLGWPMVPRKNVFQ